MTRLGGALLLVAALAAACDAAAPVQTATPSATVGQTTASSPTVLPTASASPTPTPTLGAMVADSDGTFDFLRPAGWLKSVPLLRDPLAGGPSLYLANFPLLEECAASATPLPSPSTGPPCPIPFAALPNGGVFVELYVSNLAGPVPTSGEAISVDELPSRLEVDKPGRCANLLVDEVLIAPLPEPPAGQMYFRSIVACLRGPDLDDNGRAVRAFIESIRRR